MAKMLFLCVDMVNFCTYIILDKCVLAAAVLHTRFAGSNPEFGPIQQQDPEFIIEEIIFYHKLLNSSQTVLQVFQL